MSYPEHINMREPLTLREIDLALQELARRAWNDDLPEGVELYQRLIQLSNAIQLHLPCITNKRS